MVDNQRETNLANWNESQKLAEFMIPMIGQLYRERNVVANIYGRPLINRSVVDIQKAHRFVRQVEDSELQITDSYPILEALIELPLIPSRVDIGKLAYNYKQQCDNGNEQPVEEFLKQHLTDAIVADDKMVKVTPQDIVLYGFGRIGRLLTRILIEKSGSDTMRLKAIVVRKNDKDDLIKRASLLRRDSVHGSFQGTIVIDEENNAIIANGNFIHVIYTNDPSTVDYTEYGIHNAILVDNTGRWRDEEGLSQHLNAKGIERVLLTAPGKGDIKNIVYGVNHDLVSSDDLIVSAASCTTNAIVPVLKAINDKYGLESGHVETVHSYTNDQNLIDNFHKGNRRGRSAALNMVITETGAAKAVAKALPELDGKLTGNAIRVPTPNVSMAILNLTLDEEVTKESFNEYLREMALYSPLKKQIDFVNSPDVVSSDFIGSRHAGVVDSQSTIVSGKRAVLYVWYDNEFGYSCQVIRLIQEMAGINYPMFPQS